MQACEHYCGDIPRSLVGFLRAQGPKVPYSVSDSGISADPKRQDVCLKKKRSFFPSLFTGTVFLYRIRANRISEGQAGQDYV